MILEKLGLSDNSSMPTNEVKIPIFEGTESSNEDIVYSYFRKILSQNGYSFRVKRTGFVEIDGIIPSFKSGNKGRGSCDGYIFSSTQFSSFCGLLELESNGKIKDGIKQVKTYIKGFNSRLLTKEQVKAISKIERRNVPLIVFDGLQIYISTYNLDNQTEEIIYDCIDVQNNHIEVSDKILYLFNKKEQINRETDEKELITLVSNIIRGHEKLQKNKALLMTILASIYGSTKESDYIKATAFLKNSQDEYDIQLSDTLTKFLKDIPEKNDKDKIEMLYEKTASRLFEMSQDKGMDLYGFIYEELASKENKKEQGEYYTPRHTIKPFIKSVFTNYLQWENEELHDKIILDPFCGSGGFLYEYIQFIKSLFDLNKKKIDEIAKKTLWGVDKNNTLAAYLNLFLIGDGSANIERVKTSINWRKQFLYENDNSSKFKIKRIKEKKIIEQNLKTVISDLKTFLKLYVKRDFDFDTDDLISFIQSTQSPDPINDFILEKLNYLKMNKNSNYFGNVDLLLTNIPYGKVTEANEQFIENEDTIYKNSLEANGLRECIDFLKPAKIKNGKIIEKGGIAIVIVPDSILENPSNKPIRDYLISRCDVLAIVGLPLYTFSPYAMEKTFVLVFQKIAPENFNYERELDQKCFIYYSLCDGKANSQNRYKTDLTEKVKVKIGNGNSKEVTQYIHNDFEACFDSFIPNKWIYKSKIEWAWDYNFASFNKNWDQKRIIENWTGDSYEMFEGDKWGYFDLQRYARSIEKKLKASSLQYEIDLFFSKLSEEEIENYLGEDNYQRFIKDFTEKVHLNPSDRQKLEEISFLKINKGDNENNEEIELIKVELINDVDLNPDSNKYLGIKEKEINIDQIVTILGNDINIKDENSLINFFRNKFTSKKNKAVKITDHFNIIQGTQFSKRDAYLYPGRIPVYTAATDGPSYYVSKDIPKKVKLKGKSLIWSRKGAKAGTIQIFDGEGEFYISDVSGAIQPKFKENEFDLIFLKYYFAGQVKRELQSKSNNAQLNKSKLENMYIFLPDNQKEIGNIIRKKLNTSF